MTSYPAREIDPQELLDNFLWIDGVSEIKCLIESEQSNLGSEIREIDYELSSIREKKVKGNIYLYKSDYGSWKYLGRKKEGEDHIAKLESRKAEKQKQRKEIEDKIRSHVVRKVPKTNHLIVSKKLNGQDLVRLQDIIGYPSRSSSRSRPADNS